MRGASERLAPILMTALVTALALLPLVVSGDRPGHEIEHPMAIVILGGLAVVDVAEPVPGSRACTCGTVGLPRHPERSGR